MYGWEDEKHDWEFVGNFSVLEVAHRVPVHFSLKICKNCGAYMTDIPDSNEPGYETPSCTNIAK